MGTAPEVAEAAAKAAWKRAAGDGLRFTTVPVCMYQKTLVVAVPDAGWRKQLEEMSGQLLFRINSLLGQAVVTYIEFRIDPSAVENHRRVFGRYKTDPAEERKSARITGQERLGKAARSIKDERLREQFLIAAGCCLNRVDGET